MALTVIDVRDHTHVAARDRTHAKDAHLGHSDVEEKRDPSQETP